MPLDPRAIARELKDMQDIIDSTDPAAMGICHEAFHVQKTAYKAMKGANEKLELIIKDTSCPPVKNPEYPVYKAYHARAVALDKFATALISVPGAGYSKDHGREVANTLGRETMANIAAMTKSMEDRNLKATECLKKKPAAGAATK